MAAGGKAHQALGLVGEREQPLAEADRHDGVALAVQDQDRRLHAGDAAVRAKGIRISQRTGRNG